MINHDNKDGRYVCRVFMAYYVMKTNFNRVAWNINQRMNVLITQTFPAYSLPKHKLLVRHMQRVK